MLFVNFSLFFLFPVHIYSLPLVSLNRKFKDNKLDITIQCNMKIVKKL